MAIESIIFGFLMIAATVAQISMNPARVLLWIIVGVILVYIKSRLWPWMNMGRLVNGLIPFMLP